MREFVALDFETANEQRRSACAVGLVSFDSEGKVADRYYQLLRPHPDVDYFNPINVWIHGISAEDVVDAPQWDEIYDDVAAFVADRPIVAHNMAFDGYVFSDLASMYGFEQPNNRRFCTLRLARKILVEELDRKSLDNVYDFYFPGEPFDHHHASADAEACGRIFCRMQSEFEYEQLEEMCPPTRRSRPTQRPGMLADQLLVEELIERYGNSKALENEHVVFTGTLRHGQRAAVQQLVTVVGGIPEKSLTKKTTLLVVGIPNPQAWVEGSSASRKLIKASQLRDAGSPIEVITEEEFFNRLSD
ncbi:MAG: 3'-5' exoribonuclease [Actinomycetaceae bacterium]|nr:3'-5' exoribonuclease [Actinomycetaceae bacterium]